MGRQVALIRGINVGTAKRVAMADLRTLVRGLGFDDVQTLLNSGNIVFTAARDSATTSARRIEAALRADLGIAARVTGVTAAGLALAVAENPLREIATDPSRLLVAFPATAADHVTLTPLLRQTWRPEAMALGRHVAYLWCPAGVTSSALAAALARVLGDRVTSRNWTTVTKLLALAGS